jgi:hypothetical protein
MRCSTPVRSAFSRLCFLLLGSFSIDIIALEDNQHPPEHPYLADSHYVMMHANEANTDSNYVGGFHDKSRKLRESEIQWQPLGPGEGWEFLYSGPYEDGRQVIWAGGCNILYKLDADSLNIISAYIQRRGVFFNEAMSNRFIDDIDRQMKASESDPSHILPMVEQYAEIMSPLIRGYGGFYRLIDNNNEHYQMTNDLVDGTSTLEVYGDAIEGDPDSAIQLKRHWQIPQPENGFSAGIALNMTYDGWVVIGTADGWVYAVSRDLQKFHSLQIPGADQVRSVAWTSGFMRNGVSVDPDGGIYVVTKDKIHRIQWTGSELSNDPATGAWSVAYPSGNRGSGTTPDLMGWGEGNDKLVIIADGVNNASYRVYWRDQIPEGWKGLEGEPRRLAGKAALTFGDDNMKEFPEAIESSMTTFGYGFFTYNDYPLSPPPKLGDSDKNLYANILLNGMDHYSLKGGVKYVWDTEADTLNLAWTTSEHLGPIISTVSNEGQVWSIGRQQGQWAMKALDWETGESNFSYLMGEGNRKNPAGSIIRFSHKGQIEYPGGIGWGIIRLTPSSVASGNQ